VAGLTDIYQAIISGIQAVNTVAINISKLPQTTASSSQAPQTNGTITFSSSLAEGFILFQSSSGATVKLPYYSNP